MDRGEAEKNQIKSNQNERESERTIAQDLYTKGECSGNPVGRPENRGTLKILTAFPCCSEYGTSLAGCSFI